MPSVMAMAMAMMDALIEYSAQRQYAKQSSNCRQYQNQLRARNEYTVSTRARVRVWFECVWSLSLVGAHDDRPEVEDGRGAEEGADERRKVDLRRQRAAVHGSSVRV